MQPSSERSAGQLKSSSARSSSSSGKKSFRTALIATAPRRPLVGDDPPAVTGGTRKQTVRAPPVRSAPTTMEWRREREEVAGVRSMCPPVMTSASPATAWAPRGSREPATPAGAMTRRVGPNPIAASRRSRHDLGWAGIAWDGDEAGWTGLRQAKCLVRGDFEGFWKRGVDRPEGEEMREAVASSVISRRRW
jgi:hypothetical protein